MKILPEQFAGLLNEHAKNPLQAWTSLHDNCALPNNFIQTNTVTQIHGDYKFIVHYDFLLEKFEYEVDTP